MELTCPKCHGTMRTYERNGVHVDQCADCRGIFLDRGELERLMDAENAWYGGTRGAAPGEYRDREAHEREDRGHSDQGHGGQGLGGVVSDVLSQVRGSRHGQQGYGHEGYGQQGYGHPRKKRKESFLSDLFD